MSPKKEISSQDAKFISTVLNATVKHDDLADAFIVGNDAESEVVLVGNNYVVGSTGILQKLTTIFDSLRGISQDTRETSIPGGYKPEDKLKKIIKNTATRNALARAGITSVGQLMTKLEENDWEIKACEIRNLGEKGIENINRDFGIEIKYKK